jgi:hypothetical protein
MQKKTADAMAAVHNSVSRKNESWVVESKPNGSGRRIKGRPDPLDYCVSRYIDGVKVSEHWPEYVNGTAKAFRAEEPDT